MKAAESHTRRRRQLVDLDDLGKGKAFFYFTDLDTHEIARHRKRYEDRELLAETHPEAAWDDLLDLDIKAVADVVFAAQGLKCLTRTGRLAKGRPYR